MKQKFKADIIIDGEKAILGRLASYVAKQILKGKKIAIVNSDKVIVTGKKRKIQENYYAKRRKVGDSQKGPKFSKNPEKILKRTIRGMIPEHRKGRGKQALKRVRCYNKIPIEFEKEKKIKAGKEKNTSYITLKQIYN